MRKIATLLLVLLCLQYVHAQNLAGEYFINGQGGTITLQLINSANGLQGKLTDMSGLVYNVQAEVEDGDAFGTLSTQQGAMYFEAFREGNELYLTLIPAGADGQPDASGAQEFIMTARMEGNNPVVSDPFPARPGSDQVSGQTGGPLGGPLGGPNPPDGNNNWNGTYNGNIMGTTTTIQLQVQGDQLSGLVDAGGYRYNMQGTTSGNQSQGKLKDPQTQGFFNYTATLNGSQLNLTMANPSNGQSQQVTFTKGNHAANAGSVPATSGNAGVTGNQQAGGDNRIVGAWTYTDSYSSGEYSFATQWKLIVNPDGSYIYGDGRVVGGGPGISGDSGSGGDVTRGQWKAENGVLYINTGGGWQAYARYTTNGQSLLMQFGDGSKQLWKRSY